MRVPVRAAIDASSVAIIVRTPLPTWIGPGTSLARGSITAATTSLIAIRSGLAGRAGRAGRANQLPTAVQDSWHWPINALTMRKALRPSSFIAAKPERRRPPS